jgi:hypothetical protein
MKLFPGEPQFLVVTTTAGFFSLLYMLFFVPLPEITKDILQVLLGAVAGQWTSIIQYHFGSSSGSTALRTAMIGGLATTIDGPSVTKTTVASTTEKTTTVAAPPDPDKEIK